MNTVKPVLIVLILTGIGWFVYRVVNSGPGAPPPGVADDWDQTLDIQMGGNSGSPGRPSSSLGAPASAPSFSASPGFPSADTNSAAPSNNTFPPGGASAGAGTTGTAADMAPPFQANATTSAPPFQANGATSAPPFDASAATAPPPAADGTFPATDTAANSATAAATAPPFSGAEGYPPPAVSLDRSALTADPSSEQGTPADPAGAAPSQPNGAATDGAAAFGQTMQAVQRELEDGHLKEALHQLSQWYDHPDLNPQQRAELNDLLDQVAGTVVYSTQHLLEPPYEVQPGERLEDIGQRYNVPWQLLAKINGIEDPNLLQQGERLKVVRGPFNAIISLDKREMALMLNGSYAGRFALGIGRDYPPREGQYTVTEKVLNPTYYGPDRVVDGNDADNPLGKHWIGLGDQMGIHGTNRPEYVGQPDAPGSMCLGDRDIRDVFDILSIGSKVIIRR